MHRGLYRKLAALSLLPLLAGGCAQMTRHSNTMIFGTNTVVGLKVGTNATSVPSIDLGYTRQEAVVMPLVANTGEKGTGQGDLLTPCDLEDPVEVTVKSGGSTTAGSFPAHPCKLVAVRDGAQDSYSVLASFGADFGASSEPSGATARAGLAQYFATGVAAQLLALKGGAALVATGAAANSAATTPVDPDAVSALVATDADREASVVRVAAYGKALDALLAKVNATQPGNLATQFATFEGAIGSRAGLGTFCKTAAECAGYVKQGPYESRFRADPGKFDAAVAAWQP